MSLFYETQKNSVNWLFFILANFKKKRQNAKINIFFRHLHFLTVDWFFTYFASNVVNCRRLAQDPILTMPNVLRSKQLENRSVIAVSSGGQHTVILAKDN